MHGPVRSYGPPWGKRLQVVIAVCWGDPQIFKMKDMAGVQLAESDSDVLVGMQPGVREARPKSASPA